MKQTITPETIFREHTEEAKVEVFLKNTQNHVRRGKNGTAYNHHNLIYTEA